MKRTWLLGKDYSIDYCTIYSLSCKLCMCSHQYMYHNYLDMMHKLTQKYMWLLDSYCHTVRQTNNTQKCTFHMYWWLHIYHNLRYNWCMSLLKGKNLKNKSYKSMYQSRHHNLLDSLFCELINISQRSSLLEHKPAFRKYPTGQETHFPLLKYFPVAQTRHPESVSSVHWLQLEWQADAAGIKQVGGFVAPRSAPQVVEVHHVPNHFIYWNLSNLVPRLAWREPGL